MEAIWTRFFPSTIAIQEFIASGKIGDVERIFSDLSIDFDLPGESFHLDASTGSTTSSLHPWLASFFPGLAPDATIINPNLAGGALCVVADVVFVLLRLILSSSR